MSTLITSAYAQETAAAPAAHNQAPQQSPVMSFLPFILIFFVFYFLLIRPQKKKMEQEQKFVSALQKGDEIYTKSGFFGIITGLTDKIVTLEISDGVKIKVLRSQIAGSAKNIFSSEKK
ncbi:MAG: preprotein translocase subunit YajC [Halobacteriovoraceae bacterium]|nr:preprotein translocase subunit YajC [Halobacteriovoraceae bacterium]MCB9095159.1 preprotein translocase subunit YajC [Halobacteriovoraceae bacterium]